MTWQELRLSIETEIPPPPFKCAAVYGGSHGLHGACPRECEYSPYHLYKNWTREQWEAVGTVFDD